MTCKISQQLMEVIRGLQEEQKRPRDYGTGQLLTHSELTFLAAIARRPGENASALSAHLGITRGALTQGVARLAAKGLLEEYRQPDNKKEKYYRLSADGRAALAAHAEYHERANRSLCEYLCGLDEHDTAVVFDFVAHLNTCVPFCEFTCEHGQCETN